VLTLGLPQRPTPFWFDREGGGMTATNNPGGKERGVSVGVYHRDEQVTLLAGDAAEQLAGLPERCVDCVITSPPYWGLRDYGTGTWAAGRPDCQHIPAAGRADGQAHCRKCGATRIDRQLGQEPTPSRYVDNLRRVFAQVRRVLTDAGTCWLNLGDRYATGATRADDAADGPPGGSWRARKNLLGLPWQVAFGLQTDGWTLRNAMVWHKPNAMPESVRDRLSATYELVFLLVKSERYHFDLDPIRQPLKHPDAVGMASPFGGRKGDGAGACLGASAPRRGGHYRPHQTGTAKYADTGAFTTTPGQALLPTGSRHTAAHHTGRNPGDVWTLATRPLPEAHFAAFPVDIPLRCIAAGCPLDGLVLDPFSGAATTGLAAVRLGRRYLGIDVNPAFHDIGLRRLNRHRTDSGNPPNPTTEHRRAA